MTVGGYTGVDTPFGPVYVAWTGDGVACLGFQETEADFLARARAHIGTTVARDDEGGRPFADAVRAWFAGRDYGGPVDLRRLTPFQQAVLTATRRIPRGQVATYGAVAAAVGRPTACRAVGGALRANPVPLFIPCHRVVTGQGSVGRYSSGGPTWKERLLRLEGVPVERLRAVVGA
ncbi:MAG: methylated-DNA--[protein]-cysteine S-methyltransferase [Clostridia bacterium]|nr:methylated-DNA--[protein]-cysteine S-methyltransferase [Clostridia bacterium]